MHHFQLLKVFVDAAVDVGEDGIPQGRPGNNPEGWFSLDEVITEPLNDVQKATMTLDMAMLEDLGYLKRHDDIGPVKFRPTAKGYWQVLRWPEEEWQRPEQDEPEEDGGWR